MKVYPIIGEVGRYQVESESVPGQTHLVDILEGACGCAAWTCNHRKHQAATGKPLRCKHILAAREYALNDFIEVMKEHALTR